MFFFWQVDCEGLPVGCMAHKGMVEAARSVLIRLEETRALSEALSRTGYGLVITGKYVCSFKSAFTCCTQGSTTYAVDIIKLKGLKNWKVLICFDVFPPLLLC